MEGSNLCHLTNYMLLEKVGKITTVSKNLNLENIFTLTKI